MFLYIEKMYALRNVQCSIRMLNYILYQFHINKFLNILPLSFFMFLRLVILVTLREFSNCTIVLVSAGRNQEKISFRKCFQEWENVGLRKVSRYPLRLLSLIDIFSYVSISFERTCYFMMLQENLQIWTLRFLLRPDRLFLESLCP